MHSRVSRLALCFGTMLKATAAISVLAATAQAAVYFKEDFSGELCAVYLMVDVGWSYHALFTIAVCSWC